MKETLRILIEKNKEWILEKFTTNNNIKIKNFYGGKELNWKVL